MQLFWSRLIDHNSTQLGANSDEGHFSDKCIVMRLLQDFYFIITTKQVEDLAAAEKLNTSSLNDEGHKRSKLHYAQSLEVRRYISTSVPCALGSAYRF